MTRYSTRMLFWLLTSVPLLLAADDSSLGARGTVLRVGSSECALSLGADDGIAQGATVYVHGTQRDVELQVTSVSPTCAVAVPTVLEERQWIAVGDPVATRQRSMAGRSNAPATNAGGTAVVVRVQGDRLWLSEGTDGGLSRGMVGAVQRGGGDPVPVVVVESAPTSSVARLVDTPEDETDFPVTVGEVVVRVYVPRDDRLAAVDEIARRDEERTAMERFPALPGAQGSTGLINVPVAYTTADGGVALGYTETQGYNPVTRSEGKLGTTYLTVGFLPRLELTGRFTRRDILPTSPRFDRLDRSANLKIQAVDEGERTPAIALGVDDMVGTRINRAVYVVGSKQLGGARLHLGYGKDRLDGLFMGAEARVTPGTSVMAEWDSSHVNSGLRFRLSDRFNFDAHVVAMRDLRFGLSYCAALGPRDALEDAALDARHERPSATADDWDQVAGDLADVLVADDFEDVTVAIEDAGDSRFPGATVCVSYTDRTRPRTPLAGLADALFAVASNTPANVRNLKLTVKSGDVPILHVTSRIDDYFKFLNRDISPHMYGRRVDVALSDGRESGEPAPLTSGASSASPSYLRTDISVGPEFRYDVGNPADIVRTKVSFVAEAETLVASGTSLDVQLARSVWNEFHRFGERDSLRFRRLAVRHLRRVGESTFAQALVGYLRERTYGLSAEALHVVGDGTTSVGLQANAVGAGLTDLTHRSALLDLRYRVPDLDLTASLRYGRFLASDTGAELALDRRLGHHTVGVFGAHTSFGTSAGIRVQMPFGPSRYQSPSKLRLRSTDRYAWSYRTSSDDRAKRLVTGLGLDQTAMQDDKLYPVYVLEHLERLRNVGALRE